MPDYPKLPAIENFLNITSVVDDDLYSKVRQGVWDLLDRAGLKLYLYNGEQMTRIEGKGELEVAVTIYKDIPLSPKLDYIIKKGEYSVAKISQPFEIFKADFEKFIEVVDTFNNELIAFAAETYEKALNIMRKKNADYSNTDDPVSNFKLAEALGIAPTENAVFVRLLDKVSRAANGLKKEYEVSDERFEDTIVDLLNYAVILLYIKRQRGDKNEGVFG